jgi:hypothetical protein
MIIAMQEPSAAGAQAAMDKDAIEAGGVALPPNPHALHFAPAYGQHMMQPQPHMAALEHQFAQFGLRDNNGSDHTATSTNHATDSSENNDTEHGATNEGEESEGEPVKLFVGQVPKSLNEEGTCSVCEQIWKDHDRWRFCGEGQVRRAFAFDAV